MTAFIAILALDGSVYLTCEIVARYLRRGRP